MSDFFEIKSFEQDTNDLLKCCIGNPTEEKIRQILSEYFGDNSKHMYGYKKNNEIVGLIGIVADEHNITIKHIAVKEYVRGSGIGRSLINNIVLKFNPTAIVAETDDDAVDFYRKLGFDIYSLGEKYPGVVRYKCIKQIKL